MKQEMKYGERITEEFQRAHLNMLLEQCTDEQRSVFSRMYPKGVSKDRLCWAMTQCKNSINHNEAKAAE